MTIEQLPLIMIRALTITIVIECLAAWILRVRNRHDLTVVVLVNLMTNPLVVSIGAAVLVFAGRDMLMPATLAMEALVVIVECMVYSKTIDTECNAFVLSLVCNAASYMIGEILNRLFF